MGDGAQVEVVSEVQRSARDMGALRSRLGDWLSAQVGGPVELGEVEVPASNGMSSETVLFDATWDGERRRLVARVAPEPTAVPVFPSYDLEKQARAMREVRAATGGSVPIPEVLFSCPSPEPLGTPFFVMGRVDGRVPPDVMPYNFDSWVTAATDAERRHLQDSSVETIARMHGIEAPSERFGFLEVDRPGATAMARQIADQAAYYEWAREGLRVPLIERTFAWLESNMPADEGSAVMCWGDARIGNMLYAPDGFDPVAVLDWEMAVLAPPEVDVAWFAYLHRFFEDLAAKLGAPGLPDFLRLDDVASAYEAADGGRPLRHLRFFTVYAALRYAVVSVRTTKRGIHFGQATLPDDLDDLIMHREGLEALLAGGGGPGLEG